MIDLAAPIVTLIVCAILGMAYVGGDFEGVPFAQAIAADTGLPLVCTTAPMSAIQRENLASAALEALPHGYPVEVLVAPPWG